ncbi:MAG: hypothetical protein Q9218_004452 [Villophora microphyllina]
MTHDEMTDDKDDVGSYEIFSRTFAPRAKESQRLIFERMLLANTLAVDGCYLPQSDVKRMRKLFSQRTKAFPSEKSRRANDVARRRAVAYLIWLRSKFGLEETDAWERWDYIAQYEEERPGELEDEHRAWIIMDLQARFERQDEERQKEADRLYCAHKKERCLLHDTLALRNRGGIPRAMAAVLWDIIGRKPTTYEQLWPKGFDTLGEELEDEVARERAVNYIAACRRKQGIRKDLEKFKINRKFYFDKLDETLTVEDLEAKDLWWTPREPYDEDEGMDIDEPESQTKPAEPIAGQDVEGNDNDASMAPEPIFGGEVYDESDDDSDKLLKEIVADLISTHGSYK